MTFLDSEEAPQSGTLIKNSNQNFQDLLDVFMEPHNDLEASDFELVCQTLFENRNIWNTFSQNSALSGILNDDLWQQKQHIPTLVVSNKNEVTAKSDIKVALNSKNPTKELKKKVFQFEYGEIILNHADCILLCHPLGV